MIAKKIFIIVGLLTMMIAGYSQSSIEWEKRYGGNAMEIAKCFCPLPDGGFLLAGSSASICSGAKSECLRGKLDFWLVKLNEKGSKEWDKTIGGNSDDVLKCITETHDGNFMIGGCTCSAPSANRKSKVMGNYDYWVVCLSPTGEILWERTYGEDTDDKLLSIQSIGDGGYVLTGNSSIIN